MSFVFENCIYSSSHQSTNSSPTGPWLLSLAWRRPTVHIQNREGERTQPWGHPVDDVSSSDMHPFTLTLCGVFVEKSRIQLTRVKSKPKFLMSLSASMYFNLIISNLPYLLWCEHDQSWSSREADLFDVRAVMVPGQVHSVHVGHGATGREKQHPGVTVKDRCIDAQDPEHIITF